MLLRIDLSIAAARTIDIPDLVPKSGDDTAPARSDGWKILHCSEKNNLKSGAVPHIHRSNDEAVSTN